MYPGGKKRLGRGEGGPISHQSDWAGSEGVHCGCTKCTNQPARRGNRKGHGAKGAKSHQTQSWVRVCEDGVKIISPEAKLD